MKGIFLADSYVSSESNQSHFPSERGYGVAYLSAGLYFHAVFANNQSFDYLFYGRQLFDSYEVIHLPGAK